MADHLALTLTLSDMILKLISCGVESHFSANCFSKQDTP